MLSIQDFGETTSGLLFYIEVTINGLLSGVLYSLVALGFVLIFKASGVFNFAQGAMVFFAALTAVRLMEMGWSLWLAIPATLAVMIVLAFAIERLVLRPLVNQEAIIIFMATIGLNFFIEGLAQGVWDSEVHPLDIGIPDLPVEALSNATGLFLTQFDLATAAIAGALVIVLAIFFQKTRIGRALRAVADDHQAALSVGIPLQTIWVIVWSVAGLVALVAGLAWGTKLGVQFSVVLVAFKALPVLLIGGFTSVSGAIVGGLIIGAGEKIAEVFYSPFIGGAIENWFPYVLAMIFLLVRPQGLFGEKIIERI
ncbi:MAG: branched-chain amino acid ABC transporter permease [Alphaproteobacteria bacterium]|nr:branched-chain amino acid ABC transporter permease [Alphaproteobacteria bacterium]